ncbi:MAG: 4-vinyl reductase [Bacteroidota bacterium]
MTEPAFSGRILRRFVEAAAVELGTDQLNAMLALSKLPAAWTEPATFRKMNELESARTYASMQAAMRAYYGRGARGVLLRVGQRLWHNLLEDAALASKAQAAVVKRLPLVSRRKAALELLSRFLGARPGDITLHTLDLDLLLADHVSPTTEGCTSSSPVCFVTLGLIHESLLWATGQRYDVKETSCKARGDTDCEFRITTENK